MRLRWCSLALAVSIGLVACGSPSMTTPRIGAGAAADTGKARILSESEQPWIPTS